MNENIGAAGFSNVSKETFERYPELFGSGEKDAELSVAGVGVRRRLLLLGGDMGVDSADGGDMGVCGRFIAERRPVAGGKGMC